ncbi:MFS general substrate transporter [Violaceomyces palustris]|uniref:MFS general substrate transporter n=1 Tax=Violaceomyces palustris TaxID=1673888 RepID=A0ACD0P3X6_9BASI|nr:MFS general substrate transporter [Violaceomyces palustris]
MRGANGTLSRYYLKPSFQIVLLGIVFFLCPGMFNALSGLGGGGQLDPTTANQANIALYSTFSVGSFFSGTVVNMIGVKRALFLGALGYTLFVGSFLSFNINGKGEFVTAAGAVLGFCAGMVWTAQGALMLGLPTEDQKGRFISIFWIIFNLGAVVGAGIELGLAWNSTSSRVSDSTYIAFMCLTAVGAAFSLFIKNPVKVVKDDGVRLQIQDQMDWKEELKGFYRALTSDPWILVLIPTFLASNWFYTWQFNCFNGALFNLRTRSLNNVLYWLSQMLSSLLLGLILDSKRWSRKMRAWIGLAIVAALSWSVWPGSYYKQLSYNRSMTLNPEYSRLDFTQGEYPGLCFLYIFSGCLDAVWQCFTLYIIGSITNDLSKLAHFAGLYKCFQSAGAAVAYALDRDGRSFMAQLVVNWVLCGLGCFCFVVTIIFRVTDRE